MQRKSWLALAAVGMVATLVVMLGREESASAAARAVVPGVVPPRLPATSPLLPLPLVAPDAPTDFDGKVRTDVVHAAWAELSPEEQKAVDKLQKKLNKAQTKEAKAELKAAKLADAIAAVEALLADAEELPDGTAKDKLLAKLAKKLAKLEAKLAKAQQKMDDAEALVDDLVADIELLDPLHFEDIDGLQAPDQMDVVTTGDEGGGGQAIWGGGSFALFSGEFPPNSDYVLDPVRSHVFDTSMQTLSTVDEILCFMAHTAYDAMVNQGTYVAQVDESQCTAGNEEDSGEGQSAGSGAPTPKLFVVRSERESEDAPEIMSFWVPMGGDGDDPAKANITIRARMTVTQGISDTDPYGEFKLDFAGVEPGGSLSDPHMHGTLQTLDVLDGFIGFSFFEEEGDLDSPEEFTPGMHAERTQANVNMFDDQSEGVARIRRQFRENFGPEGDTGVQTEEYLLAFDGDSVIRGANGEPGQCLSRDEFDTRVFRYTLYEAAGENVGARVERNSGFNIKTADGSFGWAGYYGLWLPQSSDELQSGDTVTKAVFGQEGEPETYTVLTAPGHLIRNTRQQLELADADGLLFDWMEFPDMGIPPGGGGGEPQSFTPPTHWRVTYVHGTGQWLKVATLDEQTQTWTDVETPEAIDFETQPVLNMFSQSLGGQVTYVGGDEHLTYFKMTFVNPSDELFAGGDDVPLYGYMSCLKGDITEQQAQSGDVFQDPSFDVEVPHGFLLRRSDMTLYLDEEGDQSNLVPATLVDGAQPQGGPFQWGIHSGPMLTDTSGLLDTFGLWNQDVFYTWETGPNSWNKLTMLLDEQGVAVNFDPPLQFSYQHSIENDFDGDPTWAGKTFLLNYNGPGDLFGIPMQPVDLDADGFPDRFYPLFSIADGVLMGPEGEEYAIKAIEKELTLKEGAPGICDGQTIGPVSGLALPDGSEYEAPDIGPKPVIDDPPAVIDGVVQTGG